MKRLGKFIKFHLCRMAFTQSWGWRLGTFWLRLTDFRSTFCFFWWIYSFQWSRFGASILLRSHASLGNWFGLFGSGFGTDRLFVRCVWVGWKWLDFLLKTGYYCLKLCSLLSQGISLISLVGFGLLGYNLGDNGSDGAIWKALVLAWLMALIPIGIWD